VKSLLVAWIAWSTWSGCGRSRFDLLAGDSSALDARASDASTLDAHVTSGATVAASSGGISDGPGRPTQTHLVYATGSAQWWLFYIDDTASALRTASSPDLVHWTSSTPVVLPMPLPYGTSFSVATSEIAGVDVIHVALGYTIPLDAHYHVRATITGTTITWGAVAEVGCSTTSTIMAHDGPAVVIDSAHHVYDITSAYNDNNACTGTDGFYGNMDGTLSTNPDQGSAWNPAFTVPSFINFAPNHIQAHWGAPTTTGVLMVQTNGAAADPASNLTNLWSSMWNGAGWTQIVGVFSPDLVAALDANDWGAVHIRDDDVRVVLRTSDTGYRWFAYNGAAWVEPAAAIPPQASIAGSGVFAATDGTSMWLFVVAADAANTLRSIKFDGTAWGSWTDVETSMHQRRYLAGYSTVSNGTIALSWTQPNGGTFDIVTQGFAAN
jgi:hypothetical protein